MEYLSTVVFESKACDGVRFTLRRMTKRRRDALEDLQAPARAKLQPLIEEYIPLNKERLAAAENKSQFPDDKFKRWAELYDSINAIENREMVPQAVRFALVSIDGLLIDGAPATLDALMECGPDELYAEIEHAVKRELGLLPEETENLKSPSTSAAAVDGSLSSGSADLAETPDTTLTADVASSTVLGSASASVTALAE